MKNMYISMKSAEDRTSLLRVLLALGLVWHKGFGDESTDVSFINKEYSYDDWNIVRVRYDGSITGSNSVCDDIPAYYWPQDMAKILDGVSHLLAEVKPIIIDNVVGYDAEISSSGIKIGCQVVSFDTFDALQNAVDNIRNAKTQLYGIAGMDPIVTIDGIDFDGEMLEFKLFDEIAAAVKSQRSK